MLAEKRHIAILNYLAQNGSASVADLCDLLNISESTVRRDLNELQRQGMLNKVFGGATVLDGAYHASAALESSAPSNVEDKLCIAKMASELIQENDFVYLDAGSTIAYIVECLTVHRATFVTNGIPAARRLTQRGYNVFVIAGQVRATAGAIIGAEAVDCLARYSFDIGFFGTSGISLKGYTNSDINEAHTKTAAMAQCRQRYVLADSNKFGIVRPVVFAKLSDAILITNQVPDAQYYHHTRIIQPTR